MRFGCGDKVPILLILLFSWTNLQRKRQVEPKLTQQLYAAIKGKIMYTLSFKEYYNFDNRLFKWLDNVSLHYCETRWRGHIVLGKIYSGGHLHPLSGTILSTTHHPLPSWKWGCAVHELGTLRSVRTFPRAPNPTHGQRGRQISAGLLVWGHLEPQTCGALFMSVKFRILMQIYLTFSTVFIFRGG